jgi:predicted PurR-regulated permease PerM
MRQRVNRHFSFTDYIPPMRQTPVAAQTTSERLATVLSYGALLLLGYLVYRIFLPFLVPLVWSAVLAIFFFPMYERLNVRLTPGRAALVSTLAVTFLLIVPALLILFFTARQGLDASAHLQAALAVHGQGPDRGFLPDVEAWIRHRLPASMQSIDIEGQLQAGAAKLGSFIAGSIGALLKNFANFFVDLFLLIFTLFFMFRDGKSVVRALRHLLPFDADIQREMMKESRELIFASVAVALVIAAIQGFLGGVAFAITGIPTPIFWGVVIAFFSLLPVVGSALVWFPGALWLGFTGHWGRFFVVVVICLGVSTVADNIVRPLLLSNRTRLNDLLLFIGVIGGLEVFGLLGLVAGPTILAAAMGVFRVYMEHREELTADS